MALPSTLCPLRIVLLAACLASLDLEAAALQRSRGRADDSRSRQAAEKHPGACGLLVRRS